MKMIAGIYKQDKGTITIDGEPIFENIKQKERIIFYLMHSISSHIQQFDKWLTFIVIYIQNGAKNVSATCKNYSQLT